jgi:hypothetical protein
VLQSWAALFGGRATPDGEERLPKSTEVRKDPVIDTGFRKCQNHRLRPSGGRSVKKADPTKTSKSKAAKVLDKFQRNMPESRSSLNQFSTPKLVKFWNAL